MAGQWYDMTMYYWYTPSTGRSYYLNVMLHVPHLTVYTVKLSKGSLPCMLLWCPGPLWRPSSATCKTNQVRFHRITSAAEIFTQEHMLPPVTEMSNKMGLTGSRMSLLQNSWRNVSCLELRTTETHFRAVIWMVTFPHCWKLLYLALRSLSLNPLN